MIAARERGDSMGPPETTLPSAGLYGLHSTTWSSVRKALRQLGGQYDRITGNHDSVLVQMPSGKKVSAGKARDTRDQVIGDGLRQLLQEVKAAKIPIGVFLAALHSHGCSWRKHVPYMVARLDELLRTENVPVHTEDGWNRAMQALKAKLEANGELPPEEPQPEPSTRDVVEEAEAVAQEAAQMVEEAKAEREAWAKARERYPLTITEVIELSMIPKSEHDRASSLAHLYLGKGKAWGRKLLAEDKAVRVYDPDTPRHKQGRWLLSEDGALLMTERLIETYGEEKSVGQADLFAEGAPEKPVEASEAPAEGEGRPVAGEAVLGPPRPPEVAVAAPSAPPGPDDALLRLCRHYGVDPVMHVDYPATLAILAEASKR